MPSTALPLAVAAATLAAASVLNLGLAEQRIARPYDLVHVPDGKVARVAALGHRTTLSDLYWLSAVQYIGDPKGDERGWDKLYPLVDLVTDLDPRHGYAYQTAGIVLSAAGRLDESNAILEKALREAPPRWTFGYYLSFNHWFYLGDYEQGAHYARIAAQTPGASPNIARLALSLSAKSGSPEDALAMIEELRDSVDDEVSRAALEEQRKLAILEREAQALERAAARFEAERGRAIARAEDLVAAGYVRELPADPFGGRWTWNPGERRFRSSANSFRFTLREGPHAPGFEYKLPDNAARRLEP